MKKSIVPYICIQALGCIDNIYEMRLFGLVIAKAQCVQKRYNKNLDSINLQHAMNMVRVTMPARYLLQEGDNNYRNVHKAFTLAQKTFDWEYEGHVFKLNMIAFPEYHKTDRGAFITFVIHNRMWLALLDFSKGHRLIELPIYMRLRSTYSVIFYLLTVNQEKPLTFAIDTLKKYTGCDTKKAYQRNNNFIAKVIEPARAELDRLAPTTFEYALQRQGRGGPYAIVKLIPTPSKHFTPPEIDTARDEALDRQRVRLTTPVTDYLADNFGMDTRTMERNEEAIARIGTEPQQLDFLSDIKAHCLRQNVRNKAGYLVRSLQNRT